ncbi:MAG: hypothetical protein R2862_03980 [Thermoanaerobaculia bacterium]
MKLAQGAEPERVVVGDLGRVDECGDGDVVMPAAGVGRKVRASAHRRALLGGGGTGEIELGLFVAGLGRAWAGSAAASSPRCEVVGRGRGGRR